jgi:acetyl esterase/lipase
MRTPVTAAAILALFFLTGSATAAEPQVVNLWPGKPPGETKELPPEVDTTRPDGQLIAGQRVIRLGNVSTPQLHIYRPTKDKDTGAAVIVCPGGGHHILAWDLEGTEVAQWLASIGITGIVLKYRVPFRHEDKRWLAAVQDAQRAVSLVRAKSGEWGIDEKRIGVLGFSAGGQTAGLAALLFERRQYEPVDKIDGVSCRPDFAALVYPGGFVDPKEPTVLKDEVQVPANAPPFFFVHAYDDRLPFTNCTLLAQALKKASVPAELHIYAKGGHGFGLRRVEGMPHTAWPERCEEWMRQSGWLGKG